MLVPFNITLGSIKSNTLKAHTHMPILVGSVLELNDSSTDSSTDIIKHVHSSYPYQRPIHEKGNRRGMNRLSGYGA